MDELEVGGRYTASVLLDFLSQNYNQVSLVSAVDVDIWSSFSALTSNNEFIVQAIHSGFVHSIDKKNSYCKQPSKLYYIKPA